MSDIKLVRWATYLLPGSLLVFSALLITSEISDQDVSSLMGLSALPYHEVFEVFVFLAVSYILGMGLWGVCYHECAQNLLLFKSHHKRLEDMQKFLTSPWYKKAKFPAWKTLFPTLPSYYAEKRKKKKKEKEKHAYHEFEFLLVKSYSSKRQQMVDRIIQDRKTIGLLQALFVGALVFALSCGVLVLLNHPVESEESDKTVLFSCIAIGSALTALMLRIHYSRRQHYLVRDALMTFLAELSDLDKVRKKEERSENRH